MKNLSQEAYEEPFSFQVQAKELANNFIWLPNMLIAVP